MILTRTASSGQHRHRRVSWDGRTVGSWAAELTDTDVVINLAGELVDRRPTPANIALLTSSRVEPTRALAAAARGLARPVPIWIQASTLAIHGDTGDRVLDETSPPGTAPAQMTGVARAWEAAARDAGAARMVILRTGIVLDAGTPALDRLVSIVRLGAGGRIATGRQWVSWIHIEDWLAILDHILGTAAAGILVASSPNPVRNRDLMSSLRRVLHRPPAPPTPAWAVRAGAVLLRTDPALALTGRRAMPHRLLEAGFAFTHPDLDETLTDLLHR